MAAEIGRQSSIVALPRHEIRHVAYVIAGESQGEVKQAIVTQFVGAVHRRPGRVLFLAATVALHGAIHIDPSIHTVVSQTAHETGDPSDGIR